eukprot:TRINITY_DN5521_c0_g1_i1.p1 TRINITY_DN5521_c0_g1~~TRINITY_DN5521_c0_g1_i1.p1  ORF type:complete len:161 (+),score=3.63 TRINITY_DN5521_c0_g1_i1:88-570(+)
MAAPLKVSKQITFALLKPDYCRRKFDIENIREDLKRSGLDVLHTKTLPRWSRRDVEKFYGTHRGRFFYQRLVQYMNSGPVVAVVMQGPNAIQAWRDLIGPTHLVKARLQPNTLRARFALSDTRNSFHGSDSVENALEEIEVLFPGLSATLRETTQKTAES